MILEEKILLSELCERFMFGLKVNTPQGDYDLISIDFESDSDRPTLWGCKDGDIHNTLQNFNLDEVKPYLRPMDDMTEDELSKMKPLLSKDGLAVYEKNGVSVPRMPYGDFIHYDYMWRVTLYLRNARLDYNGLIEQGLALPATKTMYDSKPNGGEKECPHCSDCKYYDYVKDTMWCEKRNKRLTRRTKNCKDFEKRQ